MKLNEGFTVLLVATIAYWYQLAGIRMYAHTIGEPIAPVDPNALFIHQMMGGFLARLLDPCELLKHAGPGHSLKSGKITVRYRVIGPPFISSSSSDHREYTRPALVSEHSVELPLVKSCSGLSIFNHFAAPYKDDDDIMNHDIFKSLNYILTHLHMFLENLVAWKPILDNERVGEITMEFELDRNTTTASGASLPIWMEFNRERTITLPLRDEDIKLPDLGNLDFYWQAGRRRKRSADDKNNVEADFPDMDMRFREALEWITCVQSAQRDILVSLMADGQLTLDRHVQACQGLPWSTRTAVFPKGWPLTDLPPTSTPAPAAGEEDKYKGYRWANQGRNDRRDDSVDPRIWDRFTKWLYDELDSKSQPQPDHSDL